MRAECGKRSAERGTVVARASRPCVSRVFTRYVEPYSARINKSGAIDALWTLKNAPLLLICSGYRATRAGTHAHGRDARATLD